MKGTSEMTNTTNWRAWGAGVGLILFLCLAMLNGQARAQMPVGAGEGKSSLPEAVSTPPPPPPPATNTPGPAPSASPSVVGTAQPTATRTPGPPPPVPTGYPTVTPCYNFSDVTEGDWFYQYVHWLACNNVVGGYSDGTFRPGNPSTRGQLTKMTMGAFRVPIDAGGNPSFADVDTDNTFYPYIETAARRNIISGYPCGGPGEPCDAGNRPYFRPNNHVTRGQITKIAVLTGVQMRPSRWQLIAPEVPTFVDVPANSPFYTYVETAYIREIVQGYECGGAGEPCPGRYFRPNNDATRAQIAKIVYLAALLP